MEQGQIVLNCSFDDLREKYYRVKLNAVNGLLPSEMPFDNIIKCVRTDSQAILILGDNSPEEIKTKAEQLDCWIEIETLPLEELYKIIATQNTSAIGV